MIPDEESPVTRFITHDETPWTSLASRSRDTHEIHLSQASSPATTSVGSSPTAVFSSREPSIVTKPTSYGTGYTAHDYNREGKADIAYAASLSATHGSGSETEAEHNDALGAALFGAGAWSSSHEAQGQLLRRHEHAKVRLSTSLPRRIKKPPVILHQDTVPAQPCTDQSIEAPHLSMKNEPRCLFHLVPRQHYLMVVLIGLMLLTVLLSAKALHSVDRAEAASRKRTVFAATMLVALEVLATALCARRTLLEASILGLFPLVIGSMVLLHLTFSDESVVAISIASTSCLRVRIVCCSSVRVISQQVNFGRQKAQA